GESSGFPFGKLFSSCSPPITIQLPTGPTPSSVVWPRPTRTAVCHEGQLMHEFEPVPTIPPAHPEFMPAPLELAPEPLLSAHLDSAAAEPIVPPPAAIPPQRSRLPSLLLSLSVFLSVLLLGLYAAPGLLLRWRTA